MDFGIAASRLRCTPIGNFLQLTSLRPSGQALWIYLLTGPFSTLIPGICIGGRAGIVEVLSQAVEDEKIPANPALRLGRHLRRGDEPKREVEPLSRAESAHLVDVAREHFPRWHPWILLTLRTGLRLGEQIALQWADIDWHGRFIIVHRNLAQRVLTSTKSHQRRRVEPMLVLDTSALYANPWLEDWSFEGLPRFSLVLVPATLRELDRHKDGGHPNRDVVQKAQKVVRQIREYRRRGAGGLVAGVTLRRDRSQIQAWPKEPAVAATLNWLDPSWEDDRIIASALDIGRSYAARPVAIVTRDISLETKCECAGMSFLLPPEPTIDRQGDQ